MGWPIELDHWMIRSFHWSWDCEGRQISYIRKRPLCPPFVPHLFPHLFPHIERGKSHGFRWECSKRLNPAGPTGRRAIWSRAGNSPQKRHLFRSIRMDSAQTSRQNDMICGEHHWLVVWLPFLAYFPRNIGNLIIPIDEYFSEGWPNHQPDHVEMACLSFSFSLNTFGQIPPWSDIFFQPERKSLYIYIYIYMSLIASQTECQIPNRMAHHGTKNAMRIVSRLPIDFPDKRNEYMCEIDCQYVAKISEFG